MPSPESLIGQRFLCTLDSKKGILECTVMRISPSGKYVELRISATLQQHSCSQWLTRYDFEHKVIILEVLGKEGEQGHDTHHQ